MLNKSRKKWRDLTQVRPSQYPYGYVRYKDMLFTFEELATPPYPVRPEDAATSAPVVEFADTTRWPLDMVEVGGAVISFTVGQSYFPEDYKYLQSGQTSSDYHEDVSVGGDVLSFQVGQDFFPIEYEYLQDGQTTSDYHEDVQVGGDVISFIVSTTEFLPIEYLNWPVESVEVAGDVTSFTVEPL